jgi:hypothetical protein
MKSRPQAAMGWIEKIICQLNLGMILQQSLDFVTKKGLGGSTETKP